MAKEKFNRDRVHVNVGTIGHIDHGKPLLPPPSATSFPLLAKRPVVSKVMLKTSATAESIAPQKRELVVSPSTPLTKSTRPKPVTTPTLTAQGTLTTSRT